MNDNLLYYYQVNNITKEQLEIPEWARNEHVERIVPQKELWGLRFGKERRSKRNKMKLPKLRKMIRRWRIEML